MVELVKFIVSEFIDSRDKLQVTEADGDQKKVITVAVASEDMGKIIGKQGRIAKAIRTIVKAAAAKIDLKYSVEIVCVDDVNKEDKEAK